MAFAIQDRRIDVTVRKLIVAGTPKDFARITKEFEFDVRELLMLVSIGAAYALKKAGRL